jgi:hypothetical protein
LDNFGLGISQDKTLGVVEKEQSIGHSVKRSDQEIRWQTRLCVRRVLGVEL